LGQATKIERVSVTWASGKTQEWPGEGFGADWYHRLVENEPHIKAR
jgi:hypothetical protein